MKRAAKIVLTICATLLLLKTVSVIVFTVIFSSIMGLGGMALSIAGMMSYSGYSSGAAEYIDQEVLSGFIMEEVIGGLIVLADGVVTSILSAITIFLEIIAIVVFANLGALEDKKAGYILSIIAGVFALSSSLFLGFFIIVGGILGLIGLSIEKKKKQEVR